MADATVLTIHTDGASRGNPGEAAFAYVIEQDGQEPIEEAGYLGKITNNQAEYTALVRALEHALELGAQHPVIVHSDSELMVKQMRGEYRVKNADLRPLFEQARDLAQRFTAGVAFRHVRREQNSRADALCNEVLDGKRLSSLPRRFPPEAPASPASAASTPAPGSVSHQPEAPAREQSHKPEAPARGLHQQALDVLRRAEASWAAGTVAPTPEQVWQQILTTLQQHGIAVPPAS
jgi:ribonuclease HI